MSSGKKIHFYYRTRGRWLKQACLLLPFELCFRLLSILSSLGFLLQFNGGHAISTRKVITSFCPQGIPYPWIMFCLSSPEPLSGQGGGKWRLWTVILIAGFQNKRRWELSLQRDEEDRESGPGHWLHGNIRKIHGHMFYPKKLKAEAVKWTCIQSWANWKWSGAKQSIICRQHWNQSLNSGLPSLDDQLSLLSDLHFLFSMGHQVPPRFWKGPWSIIMPTSHNTAPWFQAECLIQNLLQLCISPQEKHRVRTNGNN